MPVAVRVSLFFIRLAILRGLHILFFRLNAGMLLLTRLIWLIVVLFRSINSITTRTYPLCCLQSLHALVCILLHACVVRDYIPDFPP